MARTLVLGNGRLLVAHDPKGVVRELCWPVPGYKNHLLGRWIRLGIHIDGRFSWLDTDPWTCHQAYEGTSVAVNRFESSEHQATVTVFDWLETGVDVWNRMVEVRDGSGSPRQATLFQTQMPFVNEQNIGLCGEWVPERNGIVHYKDSTYLLFQAVPHEGQTVGYSVGVTGVAGMEGTWRDAEDGSLEEKPVSVGSVDSTLSVAFSVRPGESAQVRLAVCVAGSETRLPQARADRPPLARPVDAGDGLVQTALAVILAHSGPDGQVIAGCDSSVMGENTEHYSYVWPRDCALTQAALKAHGKDLLPACLEWLSGLPRIQGHFHQRYLPNGTPASTWHPRTCEHPFQQDETALALWLATTSPAGSALVKELLPTVLAHQQGGLPKPSWDLWEERYGVHFWTVCTVVEALDAVAKSTGNQEAAATADTFWDALWQRFFLPDGGIARRLDGEVADPTPDSSVLGGLLHCRRTTPDQLGQAVQMVERHLQVDTPVGGIARYVGDYYARVDDAVPGNPWVICTAWLGQAYARLGRLDEALAIRAWIERAGGETGLLPEQLHPQTGKSMTVQPLPWSHAEALVLDAEIKKARASG